MMRSNAGAGPSVWRDAAAAFIAAVSLSLFDLGCFREVVIDSRSLESAPDQSVVVVVAFVILLGNAFHGSMGG